MSTTTKPKKTRVNVVLPDEVLAAGQQLAAGDNRNFSNFLEVLILREAKKKESVAVPQGQEVAA